MALTPRKSGVVGGMPSQFSDRQTVADDVPMNGREGGMVINAAAIQQMGEKDYLEMLQKAYEYYISRGGNDVGTELQAPTASSLQQILVSRGEGYIEPELVSIIGEDRLTKINNRGKRATAKKIQEAEQQQQPPQQQGFIPRAAEGIKIEKNEGFVTRDVGKQVDMEDYLPIPQETLNKLVKFTTNKKPTRTQVKNFIQDDLTDEEALALIVFTETSSNTADFDDMQAIAQVVRNRIASDDFDFGKLKSVKDVALQHVANNPDKALQFSGLEPSKIYPRLKELRDGKADIGFRKSLAAAQNALNEETEGSTLLPDNTLFYTRSDAKNQWMRDSDKLEYGTEIGEHEFYYPRTSREFP